MQVCLDISAGLGQGAGISRYVLQLALALLALPDGPRLTLFHNRQALERLPPALAGLPRSQAPLGNKAWRFYLLGGFPLLRDWRSAIDGSDLFHGTDAVTPRLRQPTVITIHDLTTLLFPQHHTRLNRLYLRWALPVMAQRARLIIANSCATQRDIVAQLGVAPEKIAVVYMGVDLQRFAPQPAAIVDAHLASVGVRAPYVLALGTLEPRKNLAALLQAYALLPPSAPQLVLTGGQGWGDNPLSVIIEQLGLTKRVHLTGYVADKFLPALYSGAAAFVYPSFYEGFGLPVLEAMACGAPVITSNVSSLPEVAGEAAVLIDPQRPDQLAAALQTLLDSPAQCGALSEAGLARAHTLSWEVCAEHNSCIPACSRKRCVSSQHAHVWQFSRVWFIVGMRRYFVLRITDES